MKPFEDDQEMKELLQKLPNYQPRPGYEQRFWARAEDHKQPMPTFYFRWVPTLATGLGLLFGIFIGFSYEPPSSQRPDSLQELSQSAGLPPGSLAATVINIQGGK